MIQHNAGAAFLKRGDTSDSEDFHMTYRLRDAIIILKHMDIEFDPETNTWPAWVTDEIFVHAFNLANEVLTRRSHMWRTQKIS